MRPLVIVRPKPGNGETAARARQKGLEVICLPAFGSAPRRWEADPPESYVGVMLTSANSLRHAGDGLRPYLHLPAFAVGEATARAAHAAGFASVVTGEGDVARLIAHISTLGLHRILHLSGEDVTPYDPLGVEVDQRIVYRVFPLDIGPALNAVLPRHPVLMLHSANAGKRVAALIEQPLRALCAVVAIGPAAAHSALQGWEKVAIAAHPRDDAMLEEAARLCGR